MIKKVHHLKTIKTKRNRKSVMIQMRNNRSNNHYSTCSILSTFSKKNKMLNWQLRCKGRGVLKMKSLKLTKNLTLTCRNHSCLNKRLFNQVKKRLRKSLK